MLYRYGYYVDSVYADSYEEACDYFAVLYSDFDEEEVWRDDE